MNKKDLQNIIRESFQESGLKEGMFDKLKSAVGMETDLEKAQKAIELFSFTTEFYKSKYKAQYRLGDFSNMIETCNQGLDLLVENDTDKAIFQLDKLFGLLVLNQRAEAQTLSTKMISEINESNKGITIENLFWMSVFFKWEVPGLNDTAESFEKEGKTHRYFLNALNIKRGAALTENDFNKTDYYDSLMGYQYFQDKKDHTAACSFLKILAENLKWNEWIKQLINDTRVIRT